MGLLRNLSEALRITSLIFKRDRFILFCSLLPIVVGIIIYSFVGKVLFSDVREGVKNYLHNHLAGMGAGTMLLDFVNVLLYGILSIVLLLLINWTFVLLLGLISAPLNIIISARVERQLIGRVEGEMSEGVAGVLRSMKNEIKKIFLIILLTLFSFAISFVPIFLPVSIFLSGVILSYGFLDYNWSRHEEDYKRIRIELLENIFMWGGLGICFMSMFSIPFLNIFIFPFAVVFYSVLWILQSKHRIEIIGNYSTKNISSSLR